MILTRVSGLDGSAAPTAKTKAMLDEEVIWRCSIGCCRSFPDAFLAVQKATEARRPKPDLVECPHCEKTFVPGEALLPKQPTVEGPPS